MARKVPEASASMGNGVSVGTDTTVTLDNSAGDKAMGARDRSPLPTKEDIDASKLKAPKICRQGLTHGPVRAGIVVSHN